jgi:hypothetical protein
VIDTSHDACAHAFDGISELNTRAFLALMDIGDFLGEDAKAEDGRESGLDQKVGHLSDQHHVALGPRLLRVSVLLSPLVNLGIGGAHRLLQQILSLLFVEGGGDVLALLLPLGTSGEIKYGITEPAVVDAAFLGSLVEELVLA